jgi:hypothetical protein
MKKKQTKTKNNAIKNNNFLYHSTVNNLFHIFTLKFNTCQQ